MGNVAGLKRVVIVPTLVELLRTLYNFSPDSNLGAPTTPISFTLGYLANGLMAYETDTHIFHCAQNSGDLLQALMALIRADLGIRDLKINYASDHASYEISCTVADWMLTHELAKAR